MNDANFELAEITKTTIEKQTCPKFAIHEDFVSCKQILSFNDVYQQSENLNVSLIKVQRSHLMPKIYFSSSSNGRLFNLKINQSCEFHPAFRF